MRISKHKIKLFSIGLLAFLHVVNRIYIVQQIASLSTLINYLQYADYALMLIGVDYKGYKIRDLFIYGLMIFAGGIITFTTGESLFLSAILVILISKNEKYEAICNYLLKGYCIAFLISVLLYVVGISNSGMARRGGIALGFTHPNVCGSIVSTLVFLYWVINSEKLNRKHWIALFAAIVLNAVFLDSRTTALLLLLLPVLFFVFKRAFKAPRKLVIAITVLVPVILFLLTIYTSIHFNRNSAVYMLIDNFVNGRLTLNNYNFYRIGFSVLGQRVSIDRSYIMHNTIDCSYLVVLLQCGIVGTVIFLTGYCLTILKTITRRNYCLLAVTLLLTLAGLMENSMLDISAAFPLIYLADLNEKRI